MYVVIDLLGDEETVVIDGDTAKKKEDVHEQLVKWSDLGVEPALQEVEHSI